LLCSFSFPTSPEQNRFNQANKFFIENFSGPDGSANDKPSASKQDKFGFEEGNLIPVIWNRIQVCVAVCGSRKTIRLKKQAIEICGSSPSKSTPNHRTKRPMGERAN
jgi:hypothetical protein